MKTLFWISLFWVGYAYIGYLGLLMVLTVFRKKRTIFNEIQPSVTMIIAAHNEEKTIEHKMKNCLELDYPEDKLEIIIVSDASTDRTDQIAKGYSDSRVRLFRQDERAGKTAAQNLAVKFAKGEMLVFSDATTIYKKNALKKLVRHFSDPKVGCVGGEERFLNPAGGAITKEVSLFWRYEQLLRQKESDFNTLIGVSGCIFVIRKELYKELDETIIEDFALPLYIASKGYRVVNEKEAIGYEKAALNAHQEFARKTRIVAGGMNVVWKMGYLLNPFHYPLLAFQIISHKIFRWLAPLFMIILFLSNSFLLKEGIVYQITFTLQSTLYILAVVRFKLAYHFCMVNIADILGIVKFLKGERRVIWQPVR